MATSALPFVQQCALLEENKAKLEVALAGVSTMAFAVASRFHWTLITVLWSIAARVLIPEDEATRDLAPAG